MCDKTHYNGDEDYEIVSGRTQDKLDKIDNRMKDWLRRNCNEI